MNISSYQPYTSLTLQPLPLPHSQIVTSGFSDVLDCSAVTRMSYTLLCTLMTDRHIDAMELDKLRLIINWIDVCTRRGEHSHYRIIET